MVFASAALIFVGCQKEEVQPTENSVSSDRPTSFVEKANGNLEVWYDNGGTDYGCKDSGGNCHPEVVVHGSMAVLINTLGDLGDAGDITGLIGAVSDNLTELSTLVDVDLLDQVVDETISLSIRGRVNGNETAYLLFSDDDVILSVQPVKL